MTPTATTSTVEPDGHTAADEIDVSGIPEPVLAAVADDAGRAGILHDLNRFYATGGYATRPLAAAILRDAHQRLATTAAA